VKKTSHHPKTPTASLEVEKKELDSHETTPPSKDQEEIALLKNQIEQYRDQALRAAADLENYRKRMMREKEETIRYANNSLLEKLLPVMDNFELGLQAARASATRDANSQAGEIISGLAMVERQLNDFLKDQGLESIDAVGNIFDPKIHDALSYQIDDSLPEGQVISQLRRGYLLAGRLLRPASVIVSKVN
jgi:molecular chaperone GrpE